MLLACVKHKLPLAVQMAIFVYERFWVWLTHYSSQINKCYVSANKFFVKIVSESLL